MEHQDSKKDMRWYYGQITHLPTLTNYDAAVAHHDKIKPLRGTKPPLRPICFGYRNKKDYTIDDGFGESVIDCCLDGNRVIQFRPDGTIEVRVADPYNLMRSCDFISHVLDVTAQVKHGVMHICFEGSNWMVVPVVRPHKIGNGTSLIVRGKWRPLDLSHQDSHEPYYMERWVCKGIWSDVEEVTDNAPMVLRVNKNVAKEVRKAIKPFTNDCIRIAKLVNFDGEVLTQNLGEFSSFPHKLDRLGQCSIEELKQALEEGREGLMPIIYNRAQYRTGPPFGTNRRASTLTAASIREAVLDIAKYSHKNYFKEVPSPKGKLVEDSNRKYWRNV
jgi:hypothetical protein